MKKVIVCMASVAMLGMGMTSCQKEKDANLSKVTFTATTEADNGKTTLNGQTLTWEQEGESIMVSDASDNAATYTANSVNEAGTTATFACEEGQDITDAPFYTTYPAGIYSDHNHVTLPATQQYVANSVQGFPMYAVSEDHALQFKNLCGVMSLQLKGTEKVRSISITTDKKVNGTFEVTSTGNGYQVAATSTSTAALKTVTLNCGSGTNGVQLNMTSNTEFNLYLPVGEYGKFTITITSTKGTKVVKYLAAGASNMVVNRNTRYTMARTVEFPPVDAINGLFSISATQKIYFSKGNLYNDGSFHFEANQYDYHTCNKAYLNGNTEGSSANGTWGLFAWSKNDTRVNFGMTLKTTTMFDGGSFLDWGTQIGNGTTWWTLSDVQWDYLASSRPNANSRWALATVNNVAGLILLPDNWVLPKGSTLVCGNANEYATNSYTSGQWSILEDGGAVFLPAGGTRDGNKIQVVGKKGRYWTSFCSGNSDALNSKKVCFDKSNGLHLDAERRYFGCSVRLVQYYHSN